MEQGAHLGSHGQSTLTSVISHLFLRGHVDQSGDTGDHEDSLVEVDLLLSLALLLRTRSDGSW